MGCSGSKPAEAGDDLDTKRSQDIDALLKKEGANEKKVTKILLLGAGESGKSTVVKQIRLIYQGEYTDSDRQDYLEVILSNVTQSMQAILDALPTLDVTLPPDLESFAAVIKDAAFFDHEHFRQNLVKPLQRLYESDAIATALSRQAEFDLNDSAEYFLRRLNELGSLEYIPTNQDILRSRVKTTGIVETTVIILERPFTIVDVGGQRSERKKWLHVFESVQVLLFVVSLSEYDQQLREDRTVNRVDEALMLFESTINSRWFTKSTLIVFFNKLDLFVEKLATKPFQLYFPDFPDSQIEDPDYGKHAARHMRQKFLALRKNQAQTAYCHFTTATDTRALGVVLAAVTDSVIKGNLRATGLI